VIADDAAVVRDNESAGRSARLVAARAALQPVVERRNPGGEFGQLMRVGKRHTYCQGAAVSSARRSLSFGCGGSSRRARKASKASGPTTNSVRSKSAS